MSGGAAWLWQGEILPDSLRHLPHQKGIVHVRKDDEFLGAGEKRSPLGIRKQPEGRRPWLKIELVVKEKTEDSSSEMKHIAAEHPFHGQPCQSRQLVRHERGIIIRHSHDAKETASLFVSAPAAQPGGTFTARA